jgi:CheY-like chemotaxis protein
MKFLVVDDEYESIQPFKEALEKRYPAPSNTIIWSTTVERAGTIVRNSVPPDLIILDVMLRRIGDAEDDENGDGSEPIDINAGVEFLNTNGAWLMLSRIPVIVLTNRKSQEIKTAIEDLRFKKVDDEGADVIGEDGNPEIVSFPQNQYVVRTKLVEIMPSGLINLVSELLALFRPLD